MKTFRPGDVAYFVENGCHVKDCKIVSGYGDFYIISYWSINNPAEPAVIQLRGSRLFATKEEAESKIPKKKVNPNCNYHEHY